MGLFFEHIDSVFVRFVYISYPAAMTNLLSVYISIFGGVHTGLKHKVHKPIIEKFNLFNEIIFRYIFVQLSGIFYVLVHMYCNQRDCTIVSNTSVSFHSLMLCKQRNILQCFKTSVGTNVLLYFTVLYLITQIFSY